ncbi:MAG: thermopsin [Candidatus Aramenus sp.]|nr:thermopsin [Candidatus Aramenus sp.]
MKQVLLIILLILPVVALPTFHSQASASYPTGMTFFPLTYKVISSLVEGVAYVRNLTIGPSYLPNGAFFVSGNASLQLNAMLNGSFWAQDVALIHQVNSTYFLVTMVVNFWNLTGPFVGVKNATTFQGLGVICYQGPTFPVKTPFNLTLFMTSNGSLDFGYSVNGKEKIYLSLPYPGYFVMGGLSKIGLPNDLELVWGGPGGGSVVQITGDITEDLYYKSSSGLQVVPEALSVGLDTAESAYGLAVSGNLDAIFHPFAVLSPGYNSPSVLWPIPPSISVTQLNKTLIVKLSINGRPLPGQVVEVQYPTIAGFKVGFENVTNATGFVVFPNASADVYLVYYPGNFSLAPNYYISSSISPVLNQAVSKLVSGFENLLNFLRNYNFKKALSSDFTHVEYKAPPSEVNLTLIEYISAFLAGVLISAILAKYKF